MSWFQTLIFVLFPWYLSLIWELKKCPESQLQTFLFPYNIIVSPRGRYLYKQPVTDALSYGTEANKTHVAGCFTTLSVSRPKRVELHAK
jgi:hypothetical protein